VSGVQASLDLAAAGFKVTWSHKAPAIGGHMAQLDKTFPPMTAPSEILAPQTGRGRPASQYRGLSYTEVDSVEGEAGDFKVTLVKKPRYILESKCTGCTTCVEYCPVKYPDQFNQRNIGRTKPSISISLKPFRLITLY